MIPLTKCELSPHSKAPNARLENEKKARMNRNLAIKSMKISCNFKLSGSSPLCGASKLLSQKLKCELTLWNRKMCALSFFLIGLQRRASVNLMLKSYTDEIRFSLSNAWTPSGLKRLIQTSDASDTSDLNGLKSKVMFISLKLWTWSLGSKPDRFGFWSNL